MDAVSSNALLSRLQDLLGAQPDVTVAIVFGSAASGRLRPDSDVDVAVLADSPFPATRLRELIALLAQEAGRPVDLIDLRTAGPVVLGEALQGKRLVCRSNSAFAALVTRALIDAADFLPYRERMLRERRAAWIR